MDEILEKSLLFDFYGELLTDHQQKVYQSFVFDDLSLSEVAEEQGISRQGVHDLVKRCDAILKNYEEKLHLVEKFESIRSTAGEINRLAEVGLLGLKNASSDNLSSSDKDINSKEHAAIRGELQGNFEKIKKLTADIIEEL